MVEVKKKPNEMLIGEAPMAPLNLPMVPRGNAAAPVPAKAPDLVELQALQSALQQLQQPEKRSIWKTLSNIGQGINPMDPATFQQLQQRKIGQEFDEKMDKQKFMADQIVQAQNRQRQGQQDALAGEQTMRERELAVPTLRRANALATSAERDATAIPARKFGQRDVVRENKKYREYYDESDPGLATDTIELGPADTSQPIPGRDVPLPKDVEEQRRRMAQAGRAVSVFEGQDIDPYVKALARGEMTLAQVPAGIRDRVLSAGQQSGINIVSDSERSQINQFKKIEPILSGISELADKINTGEGLMAKAAGAAARAAAKANYDDDVAEYEALISGFTPLIARAVGHTGVLTEQDVQSVRAMFPKPGDSKSLKNRKLARIRQILGGVTSATESGITGQIGGGDGGAPAAADPLGVR